MVFALFLNPFVSAGRSPHVTPLSEKTLQVSAGATEPRKPTSRLACLSGEAAESKPAKPRIWELSSSPPHTAPRGALGKGRIHSKALGMLEVMGRGCWLLHGSCSASLSCNDQKKKKKAST